LYPLAGCSRFHLDLEMELGQMQDQFLCL